MIEWMVVGLGTLIPMAFWAGIQIGTERERDRVHAESVRRK